MYLSHHLASFFSASTLADCGLGLGSSIPFVDRFSIQRKNVPLCWVFIIDRLYWVLVFSHPAHVLQVYSFPGSLVDLEAILGFMDRDFDGGLFLSDSQG